jgi:hypothetical protein
MMDENVDLKAKTQYYSQNPQYSAVKTNQPSALDNFSSFINEDNADSMKKDFYSKGNTTGTSKAYFALQKAKKQMKEDQKLKEMIKTGSRSGYTSKIKMEKVEKPFN